MMRWLVLIACMVWAVPLAAQTDDPLACPADLAGYLPPRLVVGEAARVLTTPLNFRPMPGTSQARLSQLQPATTVEIVGGPACNEGYVWWQAVDDAQTGWLAEGDPSSGTYWTEPRGALIVQPGADGQPRSYVQRTDGTLEPADCLRPPDDYGRVSIGYATLNTRTNFMIDHATRIYQGMGGIYRFRDLITQGSYNPGGVSASFGTHDGGGAVDISVRSREDWSVLTAELPYMLEALRIAGFAAWVRSDGELYPDSSVHIHAIAVGDADLSPLARSQVDGERGYLRGYNGLPESYGLPRLDAWGQPVVCQWMIDDGFPDLREAAYYQAVGQQYVAAGDLTGALEQFTRGLTVFPQDSGLYRAREDLYRAQGQPAAARADYARYITLAGDAVDPAIVDWVEAGG